MYYNHDRKQVHRDFLTEKNQKKIEGVFYETIYGISIDLFSILFY